MNGQTPLPVGVMLMEAIPDARSGGRYDERRHQWVDDSGQPALLSASTVSGSNASTGPREETDTNEDYD